MMKILFIFLFLKNTVLIFPMRMDLSSIFKTLEFMLSSDKFFIKILASRSSREHQYKLNRVGIQPDIFIQDSITDWIKTHCNI